jgi:hypothetical protein
MIIIIIIIMSSSSSSANTKKGPTLAFVNPLLTPCASAEARKRAFPHNPFSHKMHAVASSGRPTPQQQEAGSRLILSERRSMQRRLNCSVL